MSDRSEFLCSCQLVQGGGLGHVTGEGVAALAAVVGFGLWRGIARSRRMRHEEPVL